MATMEAVLAKRNAVFGGLVVVALLLAGCDVALRSGIAAFDTLLAHEMVILAGLGILSVAVFSMVLVWSAPDKGVIAMAGSDIESPLVYTEYSSAANGVATESAFESRLAGEAKRRAQMASGAVQQCLPAELPEMPDVGKAAADAARATTDGVGYAAKATTDSVGYYATQTAGGVNSFAASVGENLGPQLKATMDGFGMTMDVMKKSAKELMDKQLSKNATAA